MTSYPDLNTALPASFVTPSRTSRILRPGIILGTVVLLGAVSVVCLGVAGAVLSSGEERTRSTNAVQALALVASSLSTTYVLIYGLAAWYNDPVGIIRPPELKLHATCFILARLALVFWFVSFVAACAMAGKPNVCLSGTRACSLQIADVVASIIGFLVTGVILTALESCKYPFELPPMLFMRKINFRTSPSGSGDDILDRSVSRKSSFDIAPILVGEKPRDAMAQKTSIEKKPLPQTPSSISEAPERSLTLLLPISQMDRSGSKSWGEEWVHLRNQSRVVKKSISTFDSAVSLSYETSSGASEYLTTSDRSSHVSMPRIAVTRNPVHQRPRSRTVTPSSSISNLSRRSPLSSVRSADYPHILVRPELRYCPPMIPPPHSWHSSRTSSISQLVPVRDMRTLYRQPSFSTSENFVIRGPRKNLPPLPRRKPPLSRRRRSDQNFRSVFIGDRPKFDYEEKLDEHLRKIEVAYVTRSQSKRNQHPSTFEKRLAMKFETLTPPPGPVCSRSRYRERPLPLSPMKPDISIRPGTAQPTVASKLEPYSSKAFRRLSLGDFSSGMGNLDGLGKMFD
ncbi:uncharacterized protein RSE6_11843 [Rhynchosporium secalis]|uniref:Uncharacterized protein n=1 Tax=Rhynchosporium secalis TaxID=38038 RepID=A0A1E1MP15_RHYSE|nr:uncharacterized protein RSE6_11843 [Rhynchosporium secalis]